MSWNTGLSNLQEILQDLYTTVSQSRQIIAKAELDDDKIAYSPARQENWFNILTELDKQEKVGEVVAAAAAADEYPERKNDLNEALQLYLNPPQEDIDEEREAGPEGDAADAVDAAGELPEDDDSTNSPWKNYTAALLLNIVALFLLFLGIYTFRLSIDRCVEGWGSAVGLAAVILLLLQLAYHLSKAAFGGQLEFPIIGKLPLKALQPETTTGYHMILVTFIVFVLIGALWLLPVSPGRIKSRSEIDSPIQVDGVDVRRGPLNVNKINSTTINLKASNAIEVDCESGAALGETNVTVNNNECSIEYDPIGVAAYDFLWVKVTDMCTNQTSVKGLNINIRDN